MVTTNPAVVENVYWYSKKVFNIFTLTLLLLTSFFILNDNVEAQQLVCPERAIEQITDEASGDNLEPSLNADGTRIAFQSRSNINGGNPEGNPEIYLFDAMTGIFTQITEETSGFSSRPSINANGTRLAFISTANINGGNTDGNFELYLFDSTTGIITQITDFTEGQTEEPSINADGTRIAIESDTNINGNFGLPNQIYIFDTTTGIFTQVTNQPVNNSNTPSLNADGTRVAFSSAADINGQNPGLFRRIYFSDTATGIITQITDNSELTSTSVFPSINADGTRIAFQSDSNINGGNPQENPEVYLFDRITGIFTQITDETSGFSDGPSINANGNRIAFASDANINGGNPDGNAETYIFDTTTSIITQITDETVGASTQPSINADGQRIAFVSSSNINGGNPEENFEIYITTCFDPATARNIPTLSEWGLLAMAGILGIVGFFVIRRRKVTA